MPPRYLDIDVWAFPQLCTNGTFSVKLPEKFEFWSPMLGGADVPFAATYSYEDQYGVGSTGRSVPLMRLRVDSCLSLVLTCYTI